MPDEFPLSHYLKAQQWEITKGHMRAMTALVGANRYSEGKYENLVGMTEDYIEAVQELGLSE
jgi:hypothetical protein